MDYPKLIREIADTYRKHGWKLERVLLKDETKAALGSDFELDNVPISNSDVDGMWFSRASHEQREAWELRLLSENPFALFESFEKDETEEQRDEVRREMEARLRDYLRK
jgi:hypothetical protein